MAEENIWSVFYSGQPLVGLHLFKMQRINGKNRLHSLETGDSWPNYYNDVSGLKQVIRAKTSEFE